ncbi:7TM diverse intracellular signaling domain-containing protein [Pedobacter sp. B4-66]|uniref:sensor histidine kinase n=1 Tax=Pedobacter sp. B4-66 TaxID=2817280 RepID=UPI001BDB166A|nr:7TM diverse intracellular signaling domain-containing protein [Pedobacter sp. B4-66]
MFPRRIICLLILLAASLTVAAKEIVLGNAEAFYKLKDAQLSKNALWINITLKNNSGSNDWYIQVPPPVNEVDLYTEQTGGGFKHLKLNDKVLYANRPVKVNGFILPLALKNGESKHYYLRIKNNYKLKVPIYAGTLEAIYEEEHFKNIVNGFMFGALLALMIYNLYIYIATRDKSYLYYLGYLFFSILFLLIWNGYFIQWLPAWSLRLLTGSCAIALAFSILFSNGYLRTHHYAPILFNNSKWLVIVFLLPILIDLPGYSVLAFQLLQGCLVIAAGYWLTTGYYSLKKGFKPAAYYLAALACLLISYGFYEGFHSSMSLQMGLCLQALVLSFALAVKLNDVKKQTMRLQTQMLDQTAGFSKQLLLAQENEKESITAELNNRVGQQLVVLKNDIYVLEKQSRGANPDLFNSITQDIGKAIEEVSNVSFSLRPYQMDTLGLKSSIERLVEDITNDTPTTIHLDIAELDQLLNKEGQMNIYRIIQELLSNLIKHAGATDCNIRIKAAAHHLNLYYQDNGKGYDTSDPSSGLGLSGIRERCKLLQAELKMSSIPNTGTKVYIKTPIEKNIATQTSV